MKKEIVLCLCVALVALFTSCNNDDDDYCETLTPEQIISEKEELGRLIFFDTSLSEPEGQSCATCHAPENAFSDITHRIVSEGAVKGLFGPRNAPTVTYAAYIPELHYDSETKTYFGGQFWDGRANTLMIQAQGPPLNPLEMGNKDIPSFIAKLKKAKYFDRFEKIYGKDNRAELDYQNMADAVDYFENTKIFKRFSSKYDEYLEGKTTLTAEEMKGLQLYETKGKCASCHILTNDPVAGKPLFTDYGYSNLGIPKNPDNPHYTIPAQYNPLGADFVDLGLGATVKDASHNGKFRISTLRNIAQTAPYGHNGYFATLEEIVHFYNTRDINPSFPPAEYPATVNTNLLGDLGLTAAEEQAIVTFLHTLTDK